MRLGDPALPAAAGGGCRGGGTAARKKVFHFFFQIGSQMAQAVESKSWPGRTEQLLHYRMIGALPEAAHVHNPSKRIAPTPVVSQIWCLQSMGNVAAFPITERIM